MIFQVENKGGVIEMSIDYTLEYEVIIKSVPHENSYEYNVYYKYHNEDNLNFSRRFAKHQLDEAILFAMRGDAVLRGNDET